MNPTEKCEATRLQKHIAANNAFKRLDTAIDLLEYFVKRIGTGEGILKDDKASKEPESSTLSLEQFLSEMEQEIDTFQDRIRKAIEEATQKLY